MQLYSGLGENRPETALCQSVIQTLQQGDMPSAADLTNLIREMDEACAHELFTAARQTAWQHFGTKIYIRGLIEFTNYCACDCLYCGIRRSNAKARRYRLNQKEILECCEQGYDLGFRTFVLQGGEDPWYTDERLTAIIKSIKTQWPDCALTLSVGERSRESYGHLREAGADRFLLRHETANADHFARLHPPRQVLASRMACLYALKECGFQTGAGFMVGSPGQTVENLVEDLFFLRDLQPEMVGIGPFLPHADTPLAAEAPGDVDRTLIMVALTRLLLPKSLLPATTALGTAAGDGRERGIMAGANVLMPNLSPLHHREKYMLYNNKIATAEEAAENLAALKKRIQAIGYQIVTERGDYAP